jgi:hypothetical protein
VLGNICTLNLVGEKSKAQNNTVRVRVRVKVRVRVRFKDLPDRGGMAS